MNPVMRIPLLGCAALLLAAPTAARACSKLPFVSVQVPRGVHLIATVRADTVAAGPGDVRYVVRAGHYGPARERPIYGQVVDVERMGGLAARGLDPAVKRVVLVPWGYGADCGPTPWTRSARWVAPGTRGLFTATLRDPAHWAGGLPTFDVHTPGANPYPQTVHPDRYDQEADSILSMDDYFSVLEILPSAEQANASAAEAFKPLFRWAEQRPELARRYPASDMLQIASYNVGYQRMRSISPPLAGTYRFEARLDDEPPRVFFARTRQRPTTAWGAGETREGELPAPGASPGYYLLAVGALSPDSLPVDVRPNRNMNREGYLAMLSEPEPGGGEVRTWRGKVELEIVARQFPADSALRRFARDNFEAFMERGDRGEHDETPARYVRSPNGEVRVEQTIRLRDGRTLRLTGTRISRETIAETR
ncbi:MAG TPA: hypothetical protein VFS20_08935 [Longimicrobium sp.]|nr:hypothetical protein [Longimicrobium sp.]